MNINITEIYFLFLLHIDWIECLQYLHIVIIRSLYEPSFYLFYVFIMDFWHYVLLKSL